MATYVNVKDGAGVAIQLDGIIYRTGTGGGNMIAINNSNDFEMFSSTSQGAMQGYGYTFLSQNTYGPRLVRLTKVNNFSFHDIKLVDSPAFHLTMDTCTNGEVYNTIIRGANKGGLDGVDVWGTNIYVHDVEVTNKDECVTVKSPAKNILVENIYCNWSGGCAMGSLSTDTAISEIKYNNIYTWQSNQMYLLKSNGGSGYVRDCSFTNFIGHSNAYALDIDQTVSLFPTLFLTFPSYLLTSHKTNSPPSQQWSSQSTGAGSGVVLSGLTFSNWKGTIVDPKRAAIQANCANGAPCTGISLSNIAFWSDTNAAIHYSCTSAYGSGYCLKSGSGGSYGTVTQTVSSAPAGYNGAKMGEDLGSGLGVSVSIAIPATIPTSFYPGATPKTKLCSAGGCGGVVARDLLEARVETSTTLETRVAEPTGGYYSEN